VATAVLPLKEWSTDVVIDVAALDGHGYTIESVRVAPSLQESISCAGDAAAADEPLETLGPTFVEDRNAFLGAPLRAVCP
jgi:hypothetical protein